MPLFAARPGQGSTGAVCGLFPPVPLAASLHLLRAGPIALSSADRTEKPAGPVETGPAGETIPL